MGCLSKISACRYTNDLLDSRLASQRISKNNDAFKNVGKFYDVMAFTDVQL